MQIAQSIGFLASGSVSPGPGFLRSWSTAPGAFIEVSGPGLNGGPCGVRTESDLRSLSPAVTQATWYL